MIEAIQLSKQYGVLAAVHELNLRVDNELFVFLGPNGAGKTTTIKMMTGLLRPSSGSVRLGGFDTISHPLQAKAMFGLVPDTPMLYDKLTAREFITFIGELYDVDRQTIRKRLNNLTELFELDGRMDDLIQSFSHGMKQKCALAAALIHDPKILFLDEPTVGLDPKSARNLKDLLRGLVKQHTTIFMSTHILEIAEAMCDRVGIINQGKLIALGTMNELRQNSAQHGQSLEDIFLQLTGNDESNDVAKFLEEK
jgi:ABC-2 type transport system ATP-binding protein